MWNVLARHEYTFIKNLHWTLKRAKKTISVYILSSVDGFSNTHSALRIFIQTCLFNPLHVWSLEGSGWLREFVIVTNYYLLEHGGPTFGINLYYYNEMLRSVKFTLPIHPPEHIIAVFQAWMISCQLPLFYILLT